MASGDEANVSYHGEGKVEDSKSVNNLTKDSNLEQLKSLRENVNWENEEDRFEFLRELYPLILDWQGQLPNIRDIFRLEEIDLLITDETMNNEIWMYDNISFIDFLTNIGYRDEPDVDEDGKPLLHRTTAVHRAFRQESIYEIDSLFHIYNRFDVNYTDEDGLTHFHVACKYGCTEVVQNFLELGQDPNILLPETGDSPLHLTQECDTSEEVTELLLRYGADPNWANKKGWTPLRLINDDFTAEVFFRINDDRCQPLQVDARDEDGSTPLHFAVGRGDGEFATMLLEKGADPNSVNAKGLTPLHFISRRYFDHNSTIAKLFFKINDELNQLVKIDAKDKLGRTSLQWAVANFSPSCIDVLLDHGADLSSFVFPSASDFDGFFEENCGRRERELYFRETSRAVVAVERLENRGYELNRRDALTFMTFLVKHGAFKKSPNVDEFNFEGETLLIVRCDDDNDDEEDEEVRAKEFTAEAKKIMVSPSLSLYDLIRLRPKEAAKQLTYKDFYELAAAGNVWWKLPEKDQTAIQLHLCEKLLRGFFRRWALYPFWELIRYRLPILCCEMIIEQLMNQDLCNILAATNQSL